MRDVLFVIGFLLLGLLVLALFAYTIFKDLGRLYRLFTGRVPMHKIAGPLILGVVGCAILFPVMNHFERKSPLHTVIKPEAENRVRTSTVARELIGDNITFGSEESYEYSGSAGDFSCSIKGSKGKGELAVSGSKVNGAWHLDSAELVIDNKRVSIPVN